MGIIAWFSHLLGGTNKASIAQEIAIQNSPAVHDMDKEAAGLNFKLAIEAHQKWKKRLLDVVEGNSEELLQVGIISRDDQCLLGKWIHGDGSQKFWATPQFVQLKANHAHFHACAGNVLHLSQLGKQSAAAVELKEGDYARISQEVIRDLVALYTQVDLRTKATQSKYPLSFE